MTSRAALGVLLVLLSSTDALASEFRVEGDTLFLDGEIKRGDTELFGRTLDSTPAVHRISINSPGGDLATGLKMGEMVRARHLETYVEAGVREAGSAAAYLFMGGTERVVKGGRGIGVHAFYTPQAELRKMIKQKSGDELLQTLNEFERRTQEGTLAVVEYVMKMVGDARIVGAAVKTGSDALVWPNAKTLVEWQVATKHVELTPDELPDPDWAYGEVVATLAAWLDPSRPDALDDRARATLDAFLGDVERGATLRADVEAALTRSAPANRDIARTRVVTPMSDSIVRQIRAAAAAASPPANGP
ncbi:MAG: hypothetical protein U0575_05095 [Phycisphaerales bacterium]